MGKNSRLYNHVYHARKQEDLKAKLGGKCEGCGMTQNLIVHRIFTPYNSGTGMNRQQTSFDANIGTVNEFTPVTKLDSQERARLLKTNRDNMVLLCCYCYSVLTHKYGRKQKIGRQEIFNTFGV